MVAIGRARTVDIRMRGGYEHASYEQLFELSAMPTLIIDHHARRIVRANRAALDFLGLEPEFVVGMAGPDLLLQPSADHLARVRALRGDETAAIREVPTESGLRTVQLAIVPSGIEGIVFVELDDLTPVLVASARADELARASEALGAIAMRMAHDVSGPLTTLTGFAELLLQPDSGLDADQRTQLLERIGTGTRALAAMTASILSEADTGSARPEDSSRSPADLFGLIRDITDAQLAECGGTLLTRASVTELPIPVRTIRQALVNLISNSIKYRDSRRQLVVEIQIDETEAGTQILVTDNGIGLPADVTQIFDAGTRGPEVGDTPGAGLGLAFARAAVERVAGSLNAIPTAHGASFRILLPTAPAVDELHTPRDHAAESGPTSGLTAPQLERILDGSPLATIVLDIAVRQIVRVNRAAADLLGLDESQILGHPGSDFVDHDAVAESLRRRVLDEPDARTGFRTDIRAASGSVPVLIWIAPVDGTALAVAQVVPVE
ncbi:MAG: ATP-binding protein [Acidimicrobiales bacterium]